MNVKISRARVTELGVFTQHAQEAKNMLALAMLAHLAKVASKMKAEA